MDALLAAGEWVAIVIGGLLVRFALAVAVLAVVLALVTPVVFAFEGGRRLVRWARGIVDLHGFEWRWGPRYSPAHLWLAERGQVVRLGLDSLAARVLAGTVQLDVLPVGSRVRAGEPIARFTSGHSTVALPAPIGGVVATVNPQLGERAHAATAQPYGDGWLVEIGPADRGYRRLPRAAEARRWFNAEAVRLTHALEHVSDYAAADGGVPIVPDHLRLTEEQSGQLAAEFLGAMVSREAGSQR